MMFLFSYGDNLKKMEFSSLTSAVNYILQNSFKFSNWSILKQDYVTIYVQKSDGEFYICGNVDLGTNSFYQSSLYVENF